ncbi:MAG: FliA/WhiG family RNA polymerase sigma factor [Planctomycetota bacterium]
MPPSREHLIQSHLPLVRHVVDRLAIRLPNWLDREDLLEVGAVGLVQAAASFDPSRNVSFKTHAFIRIKGAVLDELRKHDILPRAVRSEVRRLQEVYTELEQQMGHPPTIEDIAHSLGMDPEKVDEVMLSARTLTMTSLESETNRGLMQALRHPTMRNPLDAAALADEKTRLQEAMGELPQTERRILVMYYREQLLLREIGEILGISESRVSQLHSRALYQLHVALGRSPS